MVNLFGGVRVFPPETICVCLEDQRYGCEWRFAVYPSSAFLVDENEILKKLVRDYPLATLITARDPFGVCHLPLLWNEAVREGGVSEPAAGWLVGHASRANDVIAQADGQAVLAIFHGPQSYISAAWYEERNTVPTHNYVVVHVRGRLELLHSTEERWESLRQLTRHVEGEAGWRMETPEEGFTEKLLSGIVAFRIEIESAVGTYKLSQHHPAGRREKVIERLEGGSQTQQELARLMREATVR